MAYHKHSYLSKVIFLPINEIDQTLVPKIKNPESLVPDGIGKWKESRMTEKEYVDPNQKPEDKPKPTPECLVCTTNKDYEITIEDGFIKGEFYIHPQCMMKQINNNLKLPVPIKDNNIKEKIVKEKIVKDKSQVPVNEKFPVIDDLVDKIISSNTENTNHCQLNSNIYQSVPKACFLPYTVEPPKLSSLTNVLPIPRKSLNKISTNAKTPFDFKLNKPKDCKIDIPLDSLQTNDIDEFMKLDKMVDDLVKDDSVQRKTNIDNKIEVINWPSNEDTCSDNSWEILEESLDKSGELKDNISL